MPVSRRFLWPLALAAFGLTAAAAVPPPERLLPNDTALVVSAPDWGRARLFWKNGSYARLWQDPSLKPFKDKFIDKFTNGVLKPLEQNLGLKFSDFDGLAQGQVTYALVPVNPDNNSDMRLADILLMDTRDHAGQLKASLAQVTRKWADSGKPMQSRKIRQADFTTLIVSPDDLSWKKIFPSPKSDAPPEEAAAKPPGKNLEITVGQSDSLLVVSDSTEAIEKVLSRQAGSLAPPLAEEPAFQADYQARLHNSPFYVWLNARAFLQTLTKPPAGADEDAKASAAHLESFFSASGVLSLTSASLSYQTSREGDGTQLFLAVPEDQRPALLKIFAAEAKDASPPSFVPADAVKFWRWRFNAARSWKGLETMLNDFLPAQTMASINMIFKMAGKDKDEHYDLKSELLDNLGDDLISYQKAAKAGTLADVRSPPSLYLLASPNPERLSSALKVLLAIPFRGAPITDREFLGRKIYTATAAASPGKGTASSLSFSASGGYLALSSDASLLEEYLRSGQSAPKALRETPGLADAAQKVGGMSTGLFGFENENQSMRPVFDLLRRQPVTLQDILGVPWPGAAGVNQVDSLRQWADFSLLPSFDAVSKYFYFSVYAGSFTPDGFALKMFMPTPPQLRQ